MQNKMLTGRITTGLGKAAAFMNVEWANQAFYDILGQLPFPGTVNVKLSSNEDMKVWSCIKSVPGQLIQPPDPNWCKSFVYKAEISGKIKAAIILPDVKNYPDDQVELIASENVRERLSLQDGDQVNIEIWVDGSLD